MAVVFLVPPKAVAQQENKGRPAAAPAPAGPDLCRTIAQVAVDNELPVDFFMRLIWQESRFNPSAVSPKGAQGIAQFMPATAAQRGLANPFEPAEALRESASYLRELRATFGGNLGLAAAAYNAGPGRIEGWVAGHRTLPSETQAYVRIVTGHPAESWVGNPSLQLQVYAAAKPPPCSEIAGLIASAPARRTPTVNPAWGPWGIQLAGNWNQGRVLASYERIRRQFEGILKDRLPLVLRTTVRRGRSASKYMMRVSENSRQQADTLCDRLRMAGGACVVLRNPPTARFN